MEDIKYEQIDNIAVLTICNESKLNAFSDAMTLKLGELLYDADKNPSVRCIVITGSGDKAFSTGHDLNSMLSNMEHASDEKLNQPFVLPSNLNTPTIAAVNGYAYAAGFILAIACDFRVSAINGVFCSPGAHIGLLPIGGQISRLPSLIPMPIAKELLMTGREMSAEEAYRLGFVNKLVSRDLALQEALKLGNSIAKNSANVVKAIKQGLNTYVEDGVRSAESFEWDKGRELQTAPDAQEGIQSFLEKRSPNFL